LVVDVATTVLAAKLVNQRFNQVAVFTETAFPAAPLV
jgi:hypothetical protein